jgi:alkylhydroperoxidase/carboxymuconolactone decarboxylase family protein YurZ
VDLVNLSLLSAQGVPVCTKFHINITLSAKLHHVLIAGTKIW